MIMEWDSSLRSDVQSEAGGDPMFFVLRVDGCIHHANVGLRRLCGMPTTGTEPEHVAQYVHPRDLILLRHRRRSGNLAEIDERMRIRDAAGVYRICHVQASLIRTPQLTNHWVGVCIVDEAAIASRSALSASRDVSIRNLMSGNDCVELLGLDERLWAMSMNGTQMPEPTVAVAGLWSDFWNDADRPNAKRALDAARAGNVGRFEGRVETGLSTVSWWDVVITPIFDPEGNPESLLAISRDITPAKQLEAQLRFLAQASKILGSSLQIDETLTQLTHLAVPALVSWCALSWQGRASRSSVSFAGSNEKLQHLLEALPPYRWRASSVFVPRVSPDMLTALASDDEHFARLQSLGSQSFAAVPLAWRGETLGCLCFGTMERTLTSRDLELFEELGRRIATALVNARLFDQERRVARVLQDAMLPERLPDLANISLSTWYACGKVEADVGGDWYDAFILSDGRLALSIGDVCGSGLRAAATMGHLRQTIRAIARLLPDPAAILNGADEQLKLDAPEALATAAVIVFDPRTYRLDYALAGHPSPLVRTADGAIVELGGVGLPLGLREGNEPATQSVQLSQGSVLALYTDGLIEASRDVVQGEALLRHAFANKDVACAKNVAHALQRAVLGAGTSSRDDVAIITLAVHEPRLWQWQFDRGPGIADMKLARGSLRRALEAAHVVDVFGAQVIFGELLSNVLRYAPGPSEVRLECHADTVTLHVLDCGPGFDPDAVATPSLMDESTRGLAIVRALARALTIERRVTGGMHVAAVLPRVLTDRTRTPLERTTPEGSNA